MYDAYNFFRAQCSPCLGQSHHDVQACWTFEITFSPMWKKRQIDFNFFWQRMNQWQNSSSITLSSFLNLSHFQWKVLIPRTYTTYMLVYLDLNAHVHVYIVCTHLTHMISAKHQPKGRWEVKPWKLTASWRHQLGMYNVMEWMKSTVVDNWRAVYSTT